MEDEYMDDDDNEIARQMRQQRMMEMMRNGREMDHDEDVNEMEQALDFEEV